jgi:hypothetical protein
LAGEGHPGDALAGAGGDRAGDGGQGSGAVGGIVAELLDGEQAPVGGKADLPQRGQVGQPPADLEVVGVVDGRLGA